MADVVESKRSGLAGRLKRIIETTSSLAVIAIAALMLYEFVAAKTKTPSQSAAVEAIAVPAAPLSLDKAAFIGNPAAKAIMLEFSDFECPYCARFSNELLPALRQRYIASGQLLLAFRQLPLKIHPAAYGAALAATCAADQSKFELLHDLLFANRSALDKASLAKYATAIGLDKPSFEACLVRTAPDIVNSDIALAKALGVAGTPAFFLGTRGTDGTLLVRRTLKGARSIDEFVSAIDETLVGK